MNSTDEEREHQHKYKYFGEYRKWYDNVTTKQPTHDQEKEKQLAQLETFKRTRIVRWRDD